MQQVAKLDDYRGPRALPPRGMKGGGRPGHVWLRAAAYPVRCEGTEPHASKPIFAPGHKEIRVGDTFLKKYWETFENDVFGSRHCVACGGWIEEDLGQW